MVCELGLKVGIGSIGEAGKASQKAGVSQVVAGLEGVGRVSYGGSSRRCTEKKN